MTGKTLLLKIYLGEATMYRGKNAVQQVIKLLREHHIAGATVYRGIMGYGSDWKIREAKILELSADLPVVIEAVDTSENIEKILPLILEIVSKGLCFTVAVDVHLFGERKK